MKTNDEIEKEKNRLLDVIKSCVVLRGGTSGSMEDEPLEKIIIMCLRNNIKFKVYLPELGDKE